MKYFIMILMLFKVITSAGQYSIDNIFVDESTSDTTYVKEETDSVFRFVGGQYVFSHTKGSKGFINWNVVTSKPSTFTPSAHSHTSTSGVGSSPTASSTTTVTHNLGRVPSVIRIYGYGTFTSNAAATATTSSIGVFSSLGNFCVYQRYGAAITTTQAGLSSSTFSILLATGGGNFISGVIQNVTSTQFDIVWTETGSATAQVYLWEAQ